MMVDDMVAQWLSNASEEGLKAKLDELQDTGNVWSQRDAEMRAKLRSRVKAELSKRAVATAAKYGRIG